MKSLKHVGIVMMALAMLAFTFGIGFAGMTEKPMKQDTMKSETSMEKPMKQDTMKSETSMEKPMKSDNMKSEQMGSKGMK